MNPFRVLFLLFLVVPILEIYLLIEVGGWIGVVPTVLLVVLTAVVGVNLLRAQGLSTLMEAQQSLANGQLPATQLLEGAALLVSGALLLTPGFFTDTIGFLGLIPITRKWLVHSMLSRISMVNMQMGGAGQTRYQHTEGVVIDGEFHEKTDKQLNNK